MRYVFYFGLVILLGCGLLSCEDYLYKEIEGQWQLKEVHKDDTATSVDTVFFSFKKGVFRHLTLLTETTSEITYGIYEKKGDILEVRIPESQVNYTGWGNSVKTFTILQLGSTNLILKYDKEVYIFHKY